MNDVSKLDNSDDVQESVVQYLTFVLNGESFATEITKVYEVLEYTKLTPIPKTPDYMKGVINLRGKVVPVMDMRMQFDLEAAEVTVDTCIIIIDVNIDGHMAVVGALVDSVQEVINLSEKQMEPPPTFGARINNSYIHAMAKGNDEKFIVVLDMNKVYSLDDVEQIEKSSKCQNVDKAVA